MVMERQSSKVITFPFFFLYIHHQFSIEYQQCTGKFAADLEICCREPPPGYPVPIPVCIRGHSQPQPAPSQVQSLLPQIQELRTYSGTSITPSLAGGIGEEQLSSTGKRISRARIPSAAQSGIFIGVTGIDNDNRSLSASGTLVSVHIYI